MCFVLIFSFMALVLLPVRIAQSPTTHNVDFHVGVILDLDSRVGAIGNSCLRIAHSDFYSVHGDYKTRLVLHPIDSNDSVVDAASAALDLMRDVNVDAIIGPQKSAQVNFVMELGERAHVPIVSFSATSPSLISRTPYFVQTAQSDANHVLAIASIIEAFKWSQVVIIYEDTEFGNGIVPYLSNALQDVNARVSYKSVLPISASDDFISKELYKMMTMQTRVFVVHMSLSLGTKFFLKVRELRIMAKGYVWIITSWLTDLFNLVDSDVAEAMQGVLGVRPLIPESRGLQSFAARWATTFPQDNQNTKQVQASVFCLWAYDTLWALAMAAEKVGSDHPNLTEDISNVNSTSPFRSRVSGTGSELLKALLGTRFPGLAGEFKLVNRQLKQTKYRIVNVVGSNEKQVGTWPRSGEISRKRNPSDTKTYSTSNENFGSIIWPGNLTKAPRGWELPVNDRKLRIAVPQKPGFNDFLKVEIDNGSNDINVSGYYKDVFDAVWEELPYAIPYDFIAYPFFSPDGSIAGSYDDLVYQVSLQKDYDGAIGDITITAKRSNYVDFTMPYEEGGVACIVPIEYEDMNDVFTFLQPLTKELWLTTAIFYISTAVVIWILSKRIQRSRDSPGQHAGMICYFPFFPGQGIEGNLICLILVVWAFVASLLNSMYTANLSSRLTVSRLRPTITDTTELVKNGDYVGCQVGSFLVAHLVKLGFNESKIKTYKSVDDCHEALSLDSKNGSISAYCDVLPHIRLILARYCGKYKMVGPVNRTAGFAFAFPRGFPAVADISRAIIQLTEKGVIQGAEQRLSINLDCPGSDNSTSLTSVSLRSFLALFAITGVVTLAGLVVSLLIHLHNKRSLLQRISNFVDGPITALLEFFKQNNPSSHPKTENTRDEILEVEMGNSS